MNVAMLTTVGDRCGIAAYTRDLAASLEPLVRVDVVPIEPGKLPLERYREQATVLNAADVVHIQHEHSFWGGILPNKSAFWNLRYLIQKPVVITAHTTTSLSDLLRMREERRPVHRLAKEILVRRSGYRDSVEIAPFITGHCIVHTRAGMDDLVARGANPKYVHVIPAGIPAPLASSVSSNEPAFLSRLNDRRMVALFGFIAPNKGYEVALDALELLPEDVVLVFAGGVRSKDMEDYTQGLKDRIQSEARADSVIVTGYLSDDELAAVMRRADIVIAPHTYATGSYSITVPLAYGKAVVASDLPCFTEIAAEGDVLEIVTRGDASALAGRISYLLESPSRRSELERAAGAYAADRRWQRAAEKTAEVYREAILDVDRLSHHRMPAGGR